jgi:DNA-binding NarL/FixJ family response regulator
VKPKLSEREVEVLDCLIRGWTCREIAKELRLAPRTVKHYLKNAALKMDIKTEWMHIGLAVEWYYRVNPEKRI